MILTPCHCYKYSAEPRMPPHTAMAAAAGMREYRKPRMRVGTGLF